MWGSRPAEERAAAWLEYLDDPHIPLVKRGRDPRVTSGFAALCRRHSIDELPQLIHVIHGSMRLAGPRPMTQEELDQHYAGAIDELVRVPPGLTGLWQVMGRNRLSYAQRKRLDLFFVRRCTHSLYLSILARTVLEVVRGRDAS